MIAIRKPYWQTTIYFLHENALFQGCFTKVSFATYEENQPSYFQNGYFFKIPWWSHDIQGCIHLNPIPTRGGRFCPPLQRSHLNFPCGYVPDIYNWGPSINYVVLGGGVKNCQFYLVKRRLRRGEGVRNWRFWDDIVYGRPLGEYAGKKNDFWMFHYSKSCILFCLFLRYPVFNS